MNTKLGTILIVAALGLIILSQSVFTVDQTQQAIVLQLGQPVGEIRSPGLHFKIPVAQTVTYFDRRILPVDPPPEQMVISSRAIARAPDPNRDVVDEETQDLIAPSIDVVSGEPIIVDTFARYRITEPLQFMKTLGTVTNANSRLENIMSDATKAVLGRTTLGTLLSEERGRVMQEILQRVNNSTRNDRLGIEIVDLRIVRADLTSDLRQSTVRRMISELKERATETRARGEERALEIRSTAEKERTVIMAEAERDAQGLRGQGDETAIKTYAEAFNKDKEFYAFTRSLEAYRNSMATPDTRMILSPDSEFFKFFRQQR